MLSSGIVTTSPHQPRICLQPTSAGEALTELRPLYDTKQPGTPSQVSIIEAQYLASSQNIPEGRGCIQDS